MEKYEGIKRIIRNGLSPVVDVLGGIDVRTKVIREGERVAVARASCLHLLDRGYGKGRTAAEGRGLQAQFVRQDDPQAVCVRLSWYFWISIAAGEEMRCSQLAFLRRPLAEGASAIPSVGSLCVVVEVSFDVRLYSLVSRSHIREIWLHAGLLDRFIHAPTHTSRD